MKIKYYLCLYLFLIILIAGCKRPKEVTLLHKDESGQEIKGKTQFVFSETEPGCKEGTLKEFDINGKLRRECEYKNCRLWRLTANYKTDGSAIDKDALKDGEGEDIRYSADGVLAYKIAYKNGLPDGKAEYYDASGAPTVIVYYRAGEVIGQSGDAHLIAAASAGDTATKSGDPKAAAANPSVDLADADAIMKLIQSGEADALYNGAFSEFKKAQNAAITRKYMDYIRKLYGPIKEYKRQTYSFVGQAGVGEGMQVLYVCKFGYCKGGLELLLFRENGRFKMGGMSFQTEDYTPIAQVESLARPILENLKRGAYDDVYNAASDRFKKSTPKDKFDKMMQEIGAAGKITTYTLYKHQVAILENKLALIILYELQIGGHEVLIELSMTDGPRGFVLEGLNLQPR